MSNHHLTLTIEQSIQNQIDIIKYYSEDFDKQACKELYAAVKTIIDDLDDRTTNSKRFSN